MMNTLFFIPKAISIGPLKITFYAIFILIGAILAYKLSQGIVKKKGYDPSSLETLKLERTFSISSLCHFFI